jgi:hypothetical protein
MIAGAVYREGVAYTPDGALYVAAAAGSGISTVLASSFAAVSAPNDTTEDTLATVAIPVLSANGLLRITAIWGCTNNGNVKTVRIRYSGAAGTQYLNLGVTSTAGVTTLTWIGNRGATNSQLGPNGTSTSFAAGSITTSSVDTTAATSIVFTGQKATGTDTLTLEGYLVELVRP